MRKLSYLTALLAALFINACTSGEGFISDTPVIPPGGGGPPIDVSAVTVLASSPSLPSDPGQTLTISAVVRDTNNVAVKGVTVILATDSGTLTVPDPTTNDSGVVTATLSGGGDPTNRTITVTADANGVVGSATIDVIGTTLTISGPAALAQGFTAPYTIVLTDAAGSGIGGEAVTISSSNGNTLSATSLTTDIGGQAQVDVTASAAGTDTLTATALGLTAMTTLDVSNDNFDLVLNPPIPNNEIILNSLATVELTWTIGGAPQAGQMITFATTRGVMPAFGASSSTQAMTNASGIATATISANNAGPAVVTATNASGTSTGVQVEFIADVPDSIEVQASPFTIGPGEQSAITAIVRDINNNLVKNQVVVFDLTDVTGGQLSVATAVTDSQGRAQTFYTASSTTSANNGVTVTATVQNTPISSSVQLTVAQRELFISIGTGNSIFEPNSAQYRVEFAIQVTDSQGNGVSGVTVQAGILSNAYWKGFWFFDTMSIPSGWTQVITAGACADEDVNRNGVLDVGEDFNNSGRIEAGNIATAVAQGGSGGTFVTDSGGFGIVDIFYPQEFARWVHVTLEATTSVQGTEFAEASNFVLPINGDDVDERDEAPPGVISPFGLSTTCADTL